MKRFTETEKWKDPWFRKLKPNQKLFWLFLCDECNNAGIIDPDWELAEIFLGFKLGPIKDLLSPFDDRCKVLPSGKIWLWKFVLFQQKASVLNPANKAHKQIIEMLEKEGVTNYLDVLESSPYQGASEGLQSPPVESSTSKGKVLVKVRSRGTIDDIVEFCKSLGLPESDGRAMFFKWEENGWTNKKSPIKDWKLTIQSWKEAGYMPSQKGSIQNNGKKFADIPNPESWELKS